MEGIPESGCRIPEQQMLQEESRKQRLTCFCTTSVLGQALHGKARVPAALSPPHGGASGAS